MSSLIFKFSEWCFQGELYFQLLLQDYSFVIWLDPDVHITNVTEIKKGIEIAKKTGIATAYREHLG